MSNIPSFLLDDQMPPQCPMPVSPITCQVEVVTPMFLAGANQQNIRSEFLRSASLKGLLRWWWRAHQSDINLDPKKESLIWGGIAANKEEQKLLKRGIEVRSPTISVAKQCHITGGTGSAEYYVGYGLGGSGANDPRPGFGKGVTTTLELLPHSSEQKKAAILSLRLLCAFGGLGSRSRRTWGSLQLTKDPETSNIISFAEDPSQVGIHLAALLDDLPSRTVNGERILRSFIGANSRLVTAPIVLSHQQMLNSIHGIFKDGEKLHKDAWCFGLPHTRGKNAAPNGPRFPKVERRSSPIILKATRLSGDDRFALSALLLDGAFLDFPTPSQDHDEFNRQRPRRLLRFMERLGNLVIPITANPPRR